MSLTVYVHKNMCRGQADFLYDGKPIYEIPSSATPILNT